MEKSPDRNEGIRYGKRLWQFFKKDLLASFQNDRYKKKLNTGFHPSGKVISLLGLIWPHVKFMLMSLSIDTLFRFDEFFDIIISLDLP